MHWLKDKVLGQFTAMVGRICHLTKNVVTSMGAGSKYVMLKSFDATKFSETGEFLLNVVKEAQQIALDLYGVTCNAVVTDNAHNMVLMGKLLTGEADRKQIEDDLGADEYEDGDETEENNLDDGFVFPGMFHSRCHAHIDNLVLKDIDKYSRSVGVPSGIR